jgi:hypothetical protein
MEISKNDDGRVGAALIRVALALRADPKADFEKIVLKTAQDMDIDANFLRQYVTKSLATLRSAVAHAVVGAESSPTPSRPVSNRLRKP